MSGRQGGAYVCARMCVCVVCWCGVPVAPGMGMGGPREESPGGLVLLVCYACMGAPKVPKKNLLCCGTLWHASSRRWGPSIRYSMLVIPNASPPPNTPLPSRPKHKATHTALWQLAPPNSLVPAVSPAQGGQLLGFGCQLAPPPP